MLGDDLRGCWGRASDGLRLARAMLWLGFAGGLAHSEIVGLDVGRGRDRGPPDKVPPSRCTGRWADTRWERCVSSDATSPATALESWLEVGPVWRGPLFLLIGPGRSPVSSDAARQTRNSGPTWPRGRRQRFAGC